MASAAAAQPLGYRNEGSSLLEKLIHKTFKAAMNALNRVPVTWEEKQRALRWYRNWRSLGWLWTREHYSDPAFRQVYTENLFIGRLKEQLYMLNQHHKKPPSGAALLNRSSTTQQSVFDWLTSQLISVMAPWPGSNDVTINLLSFGCGPGVDAVALIYSLAKASEGLLGARRISFNVTLVDAVPGWKDAGTAAVEEALSLVSSFEAFNTVRFICGSWDDREVRKAAEGADIISFSHVLVDAAHKDVGEILQARRLIAGTFEAWKDQAAKAGCPNFKLVIYADRFMPDAVLPETYRRRAVEGLPDEVANRIWGRPRPNACLGMIGVRLQGNARAAAAAAPAGPAEADVDALTGALGVLNIRRTSPA